MFTPIGVAADVVWVLGLSGTLATVSYMAWYRGICQWNWRTTFSVPRMLAPLCVSMCTFCVGLMLSDLTSARPASWWETLVLSSLALVFAIQAVVYVRLGLRCGWNIPVEANKDDRA